MLGVLLMCAGCRATADTETVKIGLVAPFEGAQRALGYDVLTAVRIAIAEQNAAGGVGGRAVALVALNDEGDSDSAATQARKMAVDPAVAGVIGHWSRQTTTAALPVYEQAGLPVVIPVAGDYGASTTAFRLAPDDAALAGAAARYVATAYPGLPVLLAIDSLDLETGLRGALNEAGVSIADDAADAGVLLFSAGYEKTVQTLNAHRDLPAILLDELYTPLLESLLEDGAGGAVYGWTLTGLEENVEFRQEFEAQTGRAPGYQAGMAYRAARCLLGAMDAAAAGTSTLERPWVAQALYRTSSCESPGIVEVVPRVP